MKHFLLLVLCALALSLNAQGQTAIDNNQVAENAKTEKVKKAKKEKCYAREFKHVSRIDTLKFNSLGSFSEKIEYATKWKEKCKGFTMSFKGGTSVSDIDLDNINIAYGATMGYRAHRFRYEAEANISKRVVEGYEYNATQALAGLYLDMNKHCTTPFKPYIGGIVGAMAASEVEGISFENPSLVYGFRAGLNMRIFTGFYFFLEYSQDYSTINEIKVSHKFANGGLRLNF